MRNLRAIFIWLIFALALIGPVAIAATSPLLEWRGPVYIAGGFAGILGMVLILAQPLLAGGYLPGMRMSEGRSLHRYVGMALVLAILVHVGGLWITSPPDVIDALTFTSPTPFAPFGVIAMWAAFAAAALAVFRSRVCLRAFRLGHTACVVLVAFGTILHAQLIHGTMGTASKWALSLMILAALGRVLTDLRVWRLVRRRRDRA